MPKQLLQSRNTLLVAYYRSIGYSVDEIRLILPGESDSLPTINRRLKEARDSGYLKEIQYLDLSPEEMEEISPYLYDYLASRRLQDFFGAGRLQRVVIVPVPPNLSPEKKDERIRDLVGKAAAVHFLSILDNTKQEALTIGVSFGRTMQTMCEALAGMTPLGSNKKLRFVPLIGGLSVLQMELDPLAFKCAASTLAAELSQVFRKKGEINAGQLILNAPAFIPLEYVRGGPKEDIETAKRFVASIPEYNEIFGENGLITKMDVMVSSVGPKDAGWLGEGGPVMDTAEREQLLSEGVVGDICGRFIQQDDVMPATGKTREVNDRILGPTPQNFIDCAARAHKNKTPGVIMVANSPTKAEAVLSAIRNNCVSTLIIDSELAGAIDKLVTGLELPFSPSPQLAPA